MAKSKEQIKAAARQRKRNQREREKEALQNFNQSLPNEKAWWDANKLEKPPTAEDLLLDETLRGVLDWMRTGHKDDPADPDFISQEDGLSMVLDTVAKFGTVHLGYINNIVNDELPRDWPSRRYWADPKILAALAAEGAPTKLFFYTGLLCALPDEHVIRFFKERCGWSDERARLAVGQSFDHLGNCAYR